MSGLPHNSGIAPSCELVVERELAAFDRFVAFSTVPIKKGRVQVANVGIEEDLSGKAIPNIRGGAIPIIRLYQRLLTTI